MVQYVQMRQIAGRARPGTRMKKFFRAAEQSHRQREVAAGMTKRAAAGLRWSKRASELRRQLQELQSAAPGPARVARVTALRRELKWAEAHAQAAMEAAQDPFRDWMQEQARVIREGLAAQRRA